MTIITETEFRQRVADHLQWMLDYREWKPCAVTGPGRSGAIASVYASHFLKIPFIPYGTVLPKDKFGLLIVDTAMNSGRTLRKAVKKYDANVQTSQVFY